MRVRDLDASVKFYTQGLGFTVGLTWGPEDRRTVLLDTGDGNYLELGEGESDGFNTNGLIRHFAFRTDDCAKAIEAARAAGAEITVEAKDVVLPSDPPNPIRVGFCVGPDGEVIEFFEDDVT
jgi:glyoxylase I family protein